MAEPTSKETETAGQSARIVDRRVLPAGVMPKQLQQWVILGIAVVMMLILALAGPPKPSRSSTPQLPGLPPVVDPNAERIADYTRRVQEQAQRLAAEQAQLQMTKEALAQPGASASGRVLFADAETPTGAGASSAPSGVGAADRRDPPAGSGRVADSLAYSRPSSATSVARGAPANAPPSNTDMVEGDGAGIDTSEAAAIRALANAARVYGRSPVAAPSAPLRAESLTAAPDLPPDAAVDLRPQPVTPPQSTLSLSASRPTPQPSVDRLPAASRTRTMASSTRPLRARLSEGTVIDTVLTNRLDGTFKGPVNAMVSVPVYAGDRLVIPAGARVLGEATPVTTFGQRRLAVAFHRILLPTGERIELDAFPGLNQVGDLGLIDQVDRHYGEIFGTSIALGMLAGFTQNQTSFGYEATADDRYRQGMASSFGQSGTRILDRFLNLLPTVTIREGHRIKVYLSRDLEVPVVVRPAPPTQGDRR